VTKKIKVNLFDSLAPPHYDEYWGCQNFSSEFEPTKIEWLKQGTGLGHPEFDGVTVFTDKDFMSPWVDNVKTKYKVAWLVECRGVHPFAYDIISNFEHKFDYIFTFDEHLLKRGPKYVQSLIATSRVSDEDAGIHDKSKMLSLIASKQTMTRGHRLRHKVAGAIKDKYDVDLWGGAFKPFGKNNKGLTAGAIREGKTEPLKDYRFSVTIMNSRENNYFTETLVDVFRHGTIPIFWGCPNVGDFFNEKGILRFETGQQLFDILDSLSEDLYNSKLEYVKENFEIAKKYVSMDDTFADNLIKTIPELLND
tara:strand:+ start:184 stop:1107 length:924 start_codon:yes stop_codon:yes gene_type:complete